MNQYRIAGSILLACVAALSCNKVEEPPPRIVFGTAPLSLITAADTVRLTVEVADESSEREYGLMDRDSLAQSSGMLFIYDEVQDTTGGFWMYRTRIPLDIAFMDSTGTVVSILSMTPCESPNQQFCKSYKPGIRYLTALEVNPGFFARNGIGVGARSVRN